MGRVRVIDTVVRKLHGKFNLLHLLFHFIAQLRELVLELAFELFLLSVDELFQLLGV